VDGPEQRIAAANDEFVHNRKFPYALRPERISILNAECGSCGAAC